MYFAPSRLMPLLANTDCKQKQRRLKITLDFLVAAEVIYFAPSRANSLEDDLSLPRWAKNWLLSKEIKRYGSDSRPMSSIATSTSCLAGSCTRRYLPSKPVNYFRQRRHLKATTLWSKDDIKVDIGQTEIFYKNFSHLKHP